MRRAAFCTADVGISSVCRLDQTSSPPRSPRPGPISIKLSAARMICFLVLDHQQRVAFVAQVMHHAHEPADVARMQTDTRFVHDEERVHSDAPRQVVRFTRCTSPPLNVRVERSSVR